MARTTRKKRLDSKEQNKVCTDFYTSINKRWQENALLPETEARITPAFFIQKEINKELDEIIRTEKGPMSDLVASWAAGEYTIPDGLTALIQIMQSMNSMSDIASRIGWMNRYGLPAPLAIYILGDPRDHKRCRVFIEEGEPRIGIPEYWLWSEYAGHRRAYARYVKRLTTLTGMPDAQVGFFAEREFAHVFPTTLERRKRINMLTWSELCKEYRTIDWTTLFTAWGLDAKQLPDLVYNVTSSAFLHHVQTRIERWPIARWRGWFSLLVMQWLAGCSPHGPLRSAWFEYKCRFLQGAIADQTPQELRSAVVRAMMPNTLGRLWVTKHCSSTLRRNIAVMIDNIREAGAKMLGRTAWMSESTRKAAVRKLRKMDVQICWPDLDTWEPKEIKCGLTRTSLIENLLSLGKLSSDENQKMMVRGGCRHPYGDGWGKPVYEVNAYYYPDENRFLLPAAILRPPFYDPTKTLSWNYGAIGATIGHEFCHGFDSDGRQYDEQGDKHDWWSKNDDREYRKKAAAVVRLYETDDYRGLEVDGDLTLVENIADIAGVEFSLAGLRLALKREPTKSEYREFFTSFATSWRSKDRLKRAAELLATDTHAPPMLRVNHVVRQFDEWYAAFDLDPTCDIWIAPEKRIHFFA